MILYLIVLNLITGIVAAQYKKTEKDHAFSNSLVMSLEGDLTISQSDYMNTVPGGGIKGSAAYFFPTSSVHSFGLRLYAGREFLYGMDKHKIPDYFRTNMFLFGTGMTYVLETDGQFFPFAAAGLSFLSYHTDGIGEKIKKYGSPDYKSLGLDGEIGVNITLSKSFILSLSGGYHYLPVDLLDGIAIGKYNDFYITGSVGISYAISFGSKYKKEQVPLPKEQPKPKEQNPPVAAINTATEQIPVSIKITNLDSMVNGIKKVDKLSDIPPVKDTLQNNTVIDTAANLVYNDKVKRVEPKKVEPKSVEVKRTFPNEVPVGRKAKGSIKKDKAEETGKIAGRKLKEEVDPPEVPSIAELKKNEKLPKEILLHGELTFIRDEATIQPDAYSKLDEIAQTIKAHPGVKWKIDAYTDNRGSEKELRQFSQKRALAILKYLTKKGISPSQLKAEGKGSKDPIEDNENVWGRMMNRRVIIKRVD